MFALVIKIEMKNIHILPTDKPSRLIKIKDNLFYTTTENIPGSVYQNIYITSDEKPKEGDWHFKNDKIVTKSHIIDDTCKKIILTTDQDLINDNVQAIDDEFLEWFVKNPKCEEIKVRKKPKVHFIVKGKGVKGFNQGYKIIIPKEEHPKQIKCYCGHTTYCDCGPLEETLEEAAEKYANELPEPYNYGINSDKKKGFIEGAKWQAEQNNTSKINRVEVIQHSPPYNGRAYTNYNAKNVEIQFQDDNTTLKIFLK